MAEYTLSEFRANTRKAFDEAARGESVVIERYGEDFYLIAKKDWNNTVSPDITPEEYVKMWNEHAKNTLNVPLIELKETDGKSN